MDFFKAWIVPPLVGAIIGYFTNWLAIKMLFRPLRPIYIGKLKLPFTPGILPSERRRLTDSVGETVSRELLTTEVFKSRLEEPSLQAKIEESIYIVIDNMLAGDAAGLLRSFAGSGAQDGAQGSSASDSSGSGGSASGQPPAQSELGNLASLSFDAVLRSPEFRQALSDAIAHAAADAGKVPIGALISSRRLGEMAESFAASSGGKDIQAMVDGFIDTLAGESGKSPTPLFSDSALSPIIDVAARSAYSSLLPVVETLLSSEEVKAGLKTMAMDMVRRAVGRLGPIQRLIVSAANYEKTLADTMPDTIRDVSESLMGLLRGSGMADKVAMSVVAYAKASRASRSDGATVGATTEGYGWVVEPREGREPDGLLENDANRSGSENLIAGILPAADLKKALHIFFSEIKGDKEGFAARIEERFLTISGKPLSELLPGLSESIAKSVSESLDGRREGKVSVPGGEGLGILSAAVSSFLVSYSARIEGRSIGEIISWGENEKRKIAGILARGISQALSSQAERLVDALDVRTMVVEKLNDLDMADIERLILQVVNDELAWITILGGVLGAIIGVIQSLISVL